MSAMMPPAGEDTNEPSLVVRNRELAERPDASPDDDDDVAGPDVGDLAFHEPAARVDEHVEPIDGRAVLAAVLVADLAAGRTYKLDRKSTRLNSSHSQISYAVFCLKKKKLKRRAPRLASRSRP